MKYPEARGSQRFSLGFLSSQPAVRRSLDCQLQVFKYINQLVSGCALSAPCASGFNYIRAPVQSPHSFPLLACSYHLDGTFIFLWCFVFEYNFVIKHDKETEADL